MLFYQRFYRSIKAIAMVKKTAVLIMAWTPDAPPAIAVNVAKNKFYVNALYLLLKI